MPIERREIRLTDEELIGAVAAFARLTPGVLPDGQLLGMSASCSPEGQPIVTASVLLTADPDGPPIEVRLTYESLFELVIGFCKEEGIPMPRSGNKAAQVFGNSLYLVIDQGIAT